MPKPDWHPSPCPLPARRGEAGRRPGEGPVHGKPPFVFRMHWTMNQIGTPLPALSPPGGERVAEGRERGGSWRVPTVFQPRIVTMNQRRTGARTALSASSLDLIRADMAVRAPLAGSWKAPIRFCARIGTMNRCASQRRGPSRGSATRSLLGSWREPALSPRSIQTVIPSNPRF